MRPSVEDRAFEDEVRAFVRRACPPHVRRQVAAHQKLERADLSAWQGILHAQGWGAPGWPKEFGGTGWNPKQRFIFEKVTAEEDCPLQFHHGLGHIGPVLMAFGTPAQQAAYLPRILSGEDWWCQGYSEPSSGSDLASLRTRATREGDEYLITGQKIWTSHAHEADLMYALVRTATEDRPQRGISMVIIPMHAPGVSVRPIETIDGSHHVNEVFLDQVRIPASHLIGEEGKGWRYAKYLLERERLGGAAAIPRLMRLASEVQSLLAGGSGGRGAGAGAVLAHRLRVAQAELLGLTDMALKAIDDAMRGAELGARPSALRLAVSLLNQRLTEIGLDAGGIGGVADFYSEEESEPAPQAHWPHTYLFMRSKTIAGGTSEVQRNVIARAIFGD
jgi:alkylation response protein AidB-like acyl-CoA dehydrogenase